MLTGPAGTATYAGMCDYLSSSSSVLLVGQIALGRKVSKKPRIVVGAM